MARIRGLGPGVLQKIESFCSGVLRRIKKPGRAKLAQPSADAFETFLQEFKARSNAANEPDSPKKRTI